MTTTEGPPTGAGDIGLRLLPATPYICLTTHGAYWKLSGTFARLRSWMDEAGVGPAGTAMGIFYDDPGVTPPQACRYSICYPLDVDAADRAAEELAAGRTPPAQRPGPPAAGSTVASVPPDTLTVDLTTEITVAAVEYGGPASGSPAVYERLARWVREQHLSPAGPPREVYLAEPGTLGKGMMHAEVQQPVLVR